MAPPYPEVPFGRLEGLSHPPGGPSGVPSSRRGSPPTGPPRLPGLSIVLPCFHDPDGLAGTVDAAQTAARRASVKHEVVVVDDGSGHGTDHLAAHIAGARPGVRLVLQLGKRGYGAAVKSGIAAATMPYVLITDAGYDFDGDELLVFARELERADVVVGYRVGRDGTRGSSVWNRFAQRAYDVPVRDLDCGLRLFPRELLRSLDLVATGPMFSTELMLQAVAQGARVAEVGVSYEPLSYGRARRGVRELVRMHHRLRRLSSKKALLQAT